MSETRLTEQEVLLLEAYRKLDDQGKADVWQTIVKAEEWFAFREALKQVLPQVEILKELFMNGYNNGPTESVGEGEVNGAENTG